MTAGVKQMGRGGRVCSGAMSPAGVEAGQEDGELWSTWREARVAGRDGQWEGRLRGRGGGLPRLDSRVHASKKAAIISSFQVNEGELGGNAIFVDS